MLAAPLLPRYQRRHSEGLPPGTPFWATLSSYVQNNEKAKVLLAEAGYSAGLETTLATKPLELLNKVDTVISDKTGTLTLEQPHVVATHPAAGLSEAELLTFAAAAEFRQAHLTPKRLPKLKRSVANWGWVSCSTACPRVCSKRSGRAQPALCCPFTTEKGGFDYDIHKAKTRKPWLPKQ